jgi:hypothetical protein
MDVIAWLAQNWVEVLAIVGAVEVIATTVAKLTPTKKDDDFIQKVRKFCESVSGLFLPDLKSKK